MFKLSKRSEDNLKGINPNLIWITRRALEITTVDFVVIEGIRSLKRQKVLFRTKKTKTLNSKHLTGDAVDLAAWVYGTISWDQKYYIEIAKAMKKAGIEIGINVIWGGDWKTFKDSPHFQI